MSRLIVAIRSSIIGAVVFLIAENRAMALPLPLALNTVKRKTSLDLLPRTCVELRMRPSLWFEGQYQSGRILLKIFIGPINPE